MFTDLSSSCNDIYDANYMNEENDLSPLFHETKSHALSCLGTPFSKTELKPASSDYNDKKTTVYSYYAYIYCLFNNYFNKYEKKILNQIISIIKKSVIE